MSRFDWRALAADDYHAKAQAHRPNDPAAIAQEVRRQRASGLQPRDIAQALRVDLVQVTQILREVA